MRISFRKASSFIFLTRTTPTKRPRITNGTNSILFKIDTLLIVCHDHIWKGILNEFIIKNDINNKKSYISSLFKEGINKIAQKVGEEAVETIIEVKNNEKERFLNESADLLFHLFILLKAKGVKFDDIISVLKSRN